MVAARLGVVVVLALTGCGASHTRGAPTVPLALAEPTLVGSVGAKQGEPSRDAAPPDTAPRTGRVNAPRPEPAPTAPPPLLPSEHFTLAEDARPGFEALTIDAPDPAAAVTQVRDAFVEARRIADHYAAALSGAPSRFSVAALLGSGRVYLSLASALRAATVRPARRGADVTDVIRRALEPRARATECVGVGRLVLAARLARARLVVHEVASEVDGLLAHYTDEELTACVDLVRLGDADLGIPADRTFAPYVPGEFFRASPGLTLAPPVRVASPPLEAAE